MRRIALTLSLVLALAGVGCMANTAPIGDDGSSLGGKADGNDRSVVEVTEADDGQPIEVPLGADVALGLASNPSTGYKWHVVSTDRSFGYPDASLEGAGADGPVGSGGTEVLTWRTDGPLLQVGETHTVELKYSRGERGRASRTFQLVVEIVDAVAPEPAVDSVELGLDDDGATVEVVEGGAVIVRLPENVSTGYEWSVASTDRTFGYPEIDFEVDESGPVGSGYTAILTWQTSGPLSMVGSHTVELHYARPSEPEAEPADTFTFTVEVIEAAPAPQPASVPVVLDESDDGGSVDVVEGADVVVRLAANGTTGYSWFVTSTDRTFGYPEADYESAGSSGPVGSGGTAVLTWHTSGPLNMVGAHIVELKYSRGESGAAAKTFSFTVNVVAPE